MKEDLIEKPMLKNLEPTADFMQKLAADVNRALHAFHGKNMGFLIMSFEFGDESEDRQANFTSNCKREDAVNILRDLANRLENQAFMPPTPETIH